MLKLLTRRQRETVEPDTFHGLAISSGEKGGRPPEESAK
jgi:hypothetical protein